MSNELIKHMNSDAWRRRSRFFRNVMLNRDCVFPFLKSQDAHHMTYRNLKHEIFLRDVVPLNKKFHLGVLHPFMRLYHRKHDIRQLSFLVNWLVLRPSCLFWFLILTPLALLTKAFGWKLVSTTLLAIALLSATFAMSPSKSSAIACIITYIATVCFTVVHPKF